MMTLMKDWHFVCAPKYEFNYFLNRCQDYGTKPLLKVHLFLYYNTFIKYEVNIK